MEAQDFPATTEHDSCSLAPLLVQHPRSTSDSERLRTSQSLLAQPWHPECFTALVDNLVHSLPLVGSRPTPKAFSASRLDHCPVRDLDPDATDSTGFPGALGATCQALGSMNTAGPSDGASGRSRPALSPDPDPNVLARQIGNECTLLLGEAYQAILAARSWASDTLAQDQDIYRSHVQVLSRAQSVLHKALNNHSSILKAGFGPSSGFQRGQDLEDQRELPPCAGPVAPAASTNMLHSTTLIHEVGAWIEPLDRAFYQVHELRWPMDQTLTQGMKDQADQEHKYNEIGSCTFAQGRMPSNFAATKDPSFPSRSESDTGDFARDAVDAQDGQGALTPSNALIFDLDEDHNTQGDRVVRWTKLYKCSTALAEQMRQARAHLYQTLQKAASEVQEQEQEQAHARERDQTREHNLAETGNELRVKEEIGGSRSQSPHDKEASEADALSLSEAGAPNFSEVESPRLSKANATAPCKPVIDEHPGARNENSANAEPQVPHCAEINDYLTEPYVGAQIENRAKNLTQDEIQESAQIPLLGNRSHTQFGDTYRHEPDAQRRSSTQIEVTDCAVAPLEDSFEFKDNTSLEKPKELTEVHDGDHIGPEREQGSVESGNGMRSVESCNRGHAVLEANDALQPSEKGRPEASQVPLQPETNFCLETKSHSHSSLEMGNDYNLAVEPKHFDQPQLDDERSDGDIKNHEWAKQGTPGEFVKAEVGSIERVVSNEDQTGVAHQHLPEEILTRMVTEAHIDKSQPVTELEYHQNSVKTDVTAKSRVIPDGPIVATLPKAETRDRATVLCHDSAQVVPEKRERLETVETDLKHRIEMGVTKVKPRAVSADIATDGHEEPTIGNSRKAQAGKVLTGPPRLTQGHTVVEAGDLPTGRKTEENSVVAPEILDWIKTGSQKLADTTVLMPTPNPSTETRDHGEKEAVSILNADSQQHKETEAAGAIKETEVGSASKAHTATPVAATSGGSDTVGTATGIAAKAKKASSSPYEPSTKENAEETEALPTWKVGKAQDGSEIKACAQASRGTDIQVVAEPDGQVQACVEDFCTKATVLQHRAQTLVMKPHSLSDADTHLDALRILEDDIRCCVTSATGAAASSGSLDKSTPDESAEADLTIIQLSSSESSLDRKVEEPLSQEQSAQERLRSVYHDLLTCQDEVSDYLDKVQMSAPHVSQATEQQTAIPVASRDGKEVAHEAGEPISTEKTASMAEPMKIETRSFAQAKMEREQTSQGSAKAYLRNLEEVIGKLRRGPHCMDDIGDLDSLSVHIPGTQEVMWLLRTDLETVQEAQDLLLHPSTFQSSPTKEQDQVADESAYWPEEVYQRQTQLSDAMSHHSARIRFAMALASFADAAAECDDAVTEAQELVAAHDVVPARSVAFDHGGDREGNAESPLPDQSGEENNTLSPKVPIPAFYATAPWTSEETAQLEEMSVLFEAAMWAFQQLPAAETRISSIPRDATSTPTKDLHGTHSAPSIGRCGGSALSLFNSSSVSSERLGSTSVPGVHEPIFTDESTCLTSAAQEHLRDAAWHTMRKLGQEVEEIWQAAAETNAPTLQETTSLPWRSVCNKHRLSSQGQGMLSIGEEDEKEEPLSLQSSSHKPSDLRSSDTGTLPSHSTQAHSSSPSDTRSKLTTPGGLTHQRRGSQRESRVLLRSRPAPTPSRLAFQPSPWCPVGRAPLNANSTPVRRNSPGRLTSNVPRASPQTGASPQTRASPHLDASIRNSPLTSRGFSGDSTKAGLRLRDGPRYPSLTRTQEVHRTHHVSTNKIPPIQQRTPSSKASDSARHHSLTSPVHGVSQHARMPLRDPNLDAVSSYSHYASPKSVRPKRKFPANVYRANPNNLLDMTVGKVVRKLPVGIQPLVSCLHCI